MNPSKFWIAVGAVGPMILSAACSRSSAAEQDRATTAQREADQKAAAAQQQGDDKTRAAQAKADDETTRARDEANRQASQAQANANDVVRSANQNLLQMRSDIRNQATKKVNDLDSDVDAQKTKAQTASTTAKSKFDTALGDVETKRRVVQNELASLDTQAASALDQFKAQLQKDIDAYSSSVDQLKSTL